MQGKYSGHGPRRKLKRREFRCTWDAQVKVQNAKCPEEESGVKAEAAERNNVTKATNLHASSTTSRKRRSCMLVGQCSGGRTFGAYGALRGLAR